jgi:hypothetical protein
MKKFPFYLAYCSAFFFLSVPLAAQVPSQPKHVAKGTITNLSSHIKDLSKDYGSGQWNDLQKKAGDFLQNLNIGTHSIDSKKNFYFIIFLSGEEGEERQIIRFPWHEPRPDPFASRIPGERTIYEIVLGAKSDLELKTSYVSTKLENPLLSQIPKFVQMVEPALPALLKGERVMAELAIPTLKPAAPAINVEIRSVELPFERSRIKINDAAVLSDSALAEKIKSAADGLADSLQYRKAYLSESGQKLAQEIKSSIQKAAPPDHEKNASEQMRNAVDTAYIAHIKKHRPNREELKLAMDIEEDFLGMIERLGAKEETAEFDYENVPLEQVSFGLISTFLFGNSFTDQRIKVTDAGYYASDPPKNPLTAAIINFHPFPYDPKSAKMAFSEMWRLYGGFVLTPDVGFCVGTGFSCLRGLSFNIGVAFVGIQSKNDPDSVLVDGKTFEKPRNPDSPFKTKWGSVFFLGFGYNFE